MARGDCAENSSAFDKRYYNRKVGENREYILSEFWESFVHFHAIEEFNHLTGTDLENPSILSLLEDLMYESRATRVHKLTRTSRSETISTISIVCK